MTTMTTLHGEMTIRAILRRRFTLSILTLMPVAFYFVSHETVGRAIRALVFGLSWALSTVAFFAAVAARQIEPRLRLAGWRQMQLQLGRLLGLLGVATALTSIFGLLVAVDKDVRSFGGVVLDFSVTCLVAIAVGSAVGAVISKELEGTLVLFFVAGLQAVMDPADAYSRLLPLWSSRELATWAIDGPDAASVSAGLTHAAIVIAICAVIVTVATRRQLSRRDR